MKKKLTIAVDIDEVISDHAEEFIKFSNDYYGTNLEVQDYTEHWAELFKIDNKEVENLANQAYKDGFLKKLNNKPDSLEVLKKLKQKYNLVVVTARKTMLRDDTLQWLDEKYQGIFSDVHFAGIWDEVKDTSVTATKKEVIEQIGADFLIDDQPKHCEAVAEVGVRAILFGDYNWNKDYKPHPNIIKISTWHEVGDYLWSLEIN